MSSINQYFPQADENTGFYLPIKFHSFAYHSVNCLRPNQRLQTFTLLVLRKLKMGNNASKLNAVYSIHDHTLEVSILELQGSCSEKQLKNTDPAFSWTLNSERNNNG